MMDCNGAILGKRVGLLSFALAVLVWAIFTWPLPAHVTTAIPWSAHHFKGGERVNPTEPCDQLQFMYHYWLASDMLAGHTPLFQNRYELNFGNDAATYHPDTYFVPFSLLYALGQWLVSSAFGMNLVGFVSVWLTLWFTILLARRYCDDGLIIMFSAVVTLALPYRWHNQLGGSPAGIAMVLVPMVYWGLDRAVRDRSWWGGTVAGLGILFACSSDTHVFVFAVLSAPCWCLLALANRPDFRWKQLSDWLRLIPPLIPTAIGLMLAMWVSSHLAARLEDAVNSSGRDIVEVRNFSPLKRGLFTWGYFPMSNLIYIGFVVPALLALGGVSLLWSVRNRQGQSAVAVRSLVTALLLGGGIVMVILLGLGTNAPPDGLWTRAARAIIPHYKMIRQTTKIFCAMPTFLAIGLSVVLPFLLFRLKGRLGRVVLLSLLALAAVSEYRVQMNPAIMILDKEQGAYKAVADDAAARHVAPRAILAVLWPGDSHETALYQYYASLYRIRMVNGYTPTVSRDFMENVYRRFESINMGQLTDEQIDALLGKGIDYVMLHEDRCPEKVSPFPVGFTLKNLLNHPRLHLFNHSGEVWAFKLLKQPETKSLHGGDWNAWFPARRWEAEKCAGTNNIWLTDVSASYKACSVLNAANARLRTPTNAVSPVDHIRYMVRIRGTGTVEATTRVGVWTRDSVPVTVATPDWQWINVPIAPVDHYTNLVFGLSNQTGYVDVDMIMLAAGNDWQSDLKPGESVELPAPLFFHGGHVDLEKNAVVCEADRRHGLMFYGPKLPLEKGHYSAELMYHADAKEGTELGAFFASLNDERELAQERVIVGKPALLEWTQPDNRPFNIVFIFNGAATIELQRVVVKRLD